jgi:hypothetical protein
MSKTVVYSSCSRISCAGAESPQVVLCLSDDTLLSSGRSTIEGTLTKVYKSTECCDSPVWRYVVSYDESLLTDPSVLLTATDIEGIFCKGCLTTWVVDEIDRHITNDITVDNTLSVDLSLSSDPQILTANVNISANADNILSIEADGLYVPAPAAIDPGTVEFTIRTTAPSGWLLLQGGTIGSAASLATVRANDDTEDLFVALWNSFADAQAPVSGGRGVSAVADFGLAKTITLPDLRQRFILGTAAAGTGSVHGGTGGSIDHTHSLPAHFHGMGTGSDLNITSSGSGVSSNPSNLWTQNTPTGAGAYTGTAGFGTGGTFTCATGVNHIFTYQNQTGTQFINHTHNTPNHTHPSSAVAGRVGLVTGGVDGNAPMVSGGNNPPFITLNGIIKL